MIFPVVLYYDMIKPTEYIKDMRILPLSEQHQIKNNFQKKSADSDNVVDVKINKENLHIASGITLATIAIVGGFLMTSKVFKKNADKYLIKFKYFLEKRLEKNVGEKSEKWVKFYKKTIDGVDSFIKKSESINNITSLKDILFMKLMYKSKPTEKIHKSISDYFEKISRKTVVNSYKKTEKNFQNMNKAFDDLDKLILKSSPDEIIEYDNKKYTKKELIKLAQSHRDSANTIVQIFTSKESMERRYKYINDVTSDLYSNFWNASFKDFWSKNNKFKRKEMWQTFIAAEQIKGDKTKLADMISGTRISIIYKNKDKKRLLQKYLNNLVDIMPVGEKNYTDITKKLIFYSKHPEALNNNKPEFLKELSKLEKYTITLPDKNIAETQNYSKNMCISIIKDLIDDKTKGELQKMLSIYNKIAPLELDRTGAFYSVEKAVKSFDKSVNYESVEFFDKIRDLRLGSAPTDILTLLFSSIALALGLGYARDKDQKTSVMFKSGIPVLGGIATTMYCTTRLVSGGKSLALGFVAGFILNKIGSVTDNIYKYQRTNKLLSATPKQQLQANHKNA